jgi:hypothetical protein
MSESKTCIADRITIYVSYYMDHIFEDKWVYVDENNYNLGCKKIKVPHVFKPETRELALKLSKELRGQLWMVGKNPRVIAAAIVYLAGLSCGERVSQPLISKNRNISVGSIAKTFRMLRRLDYIIAAIKEHGYMRFKESWEDEL